MITYTELGKERHRQDVERNVWEMPMSSREILIPTDAADYGWEFQIVLMFHACHQTIEGGLDLGALFLEHCMLSKPPPLEYYRVNLI